MDSPDCCGLMVGVARQAEARLPLFYSRCLEAGSDEVRATEMVGRKKKRGLKRG